MADVEHDLAVYQQNIARLASDQTGSGAPAPKRGGEPPAAFQLIREALDAPDAALLTPEYLKYKTEQEAQGGIVCCPLRWHLLRALGPLDEAPATPPNKRQCKVVGASGELMEEEEM